MSPASVDCVGIDLSSRAVSRQVFLALHSLTSVFGMGTGGPCAFETPTCVSIDLFSRAVSHQVSSALHSLTSVFGMGTGGPCAFKTLTIYTTVSRYISFGAPSGIRTLNNFVALLLVILGRTLYKSFLFFKFPYHRYPHARRIGVLLPGLSPGRVTKRKNHPLDGNRDSNPE